MTAKMLLFENLYLLRACFGACMVVLPYPSGNLPDGTVAAVSSSVLCLWDHGESLRPLLIGKSLKSIRISSPDAGRRGASKSWSRQVYRSDCIAHARLISFGFVLAPSRRSEVD
jgi:hypothetical protein